MANIFESISCFITGIAYIPVALGSPGPFDKKTPSGFKLIMSLYDEVQGTNDIFLNLEDRHLNIFFFTP